MDLKTFSEDGFDPKDWINRAWSASVNQEKEAFVSTTVARLQLYMKQLANSLEETTTQIVSSIPRTLQEASAVQLEASVLQQRLKSLEEKVQDVQEKTGHSIESLQQIDHLKSKLENAASALRESDKWTALATALEDVLESGVPTHSDKLTELATQVAAMTASLEVLSEAPDYDLKRLQLETLYNRLEAAVSPPLIEAITQMDSERTAIYVQLFQGMSRGVSVCRCWRRAAATRLAASWRRLDVHTLPALTRLLSAEASKQVEWLTNVLKSETPLSELVRLYTDLLLSLDPSPSKVVSANLKLCPTPEEGVSMLVDLRRDIDELVACITTVVDAPWTHKETLQPSTIRELGRAAYAPLRDLLPKYVDLQSQLFLGHIDKKQLDQEDILERSRALLTMAERCEGWFSSANSKAMSIAGVAVYPYYAPAIENFVSSMTSHIASHGRRIETDFLSSVTAGRTAGVLSGLFPASLLLEKAAGTLLDALAKRQAIESADEDPKSDSPLHDLPTLLLETEVRQRLPALRADATPSAGALRRAKEHVRGLARAILRNPVDAQLEKIPQLSVWNNNDALSTELPDFALSPQEYITEIGQYLMTLPQHLEMHITEKEAPWQYLSEVCTHTCEVYAEKILNIRNMDALGTKRCLTDIVYLSSVVEDLGTSITPALKSLEKSLRAATPSPAAE